ncbi:hypothetical protein BJ165DRAFT_1550554 [Panaeolus papilionaceus]|nr:hypothetical protein BJ165DRAFT_1550554 [Panaeolus papilionaceus]
MSIYIILGTPSAFDFHTFSEATSRSLELLAPLAELHDTIWSISAEPGFFFSSPRAQAIVGQVHQYIDAIQSGFVAAQYGYTAADDIISLSQVLDSTTKEEREAYMIGTLELANKAYAASTESYQAFRSIGATLVFLMEQYVDELRSGHSGEIRGGSSSRTLSTMQHLKSQLYVLENFAAHASALARWWDWVRIEINPRPIAYAGMSPVSFDFDSLRQRSVIQLWILLRNQFADYTNMGRRLQGVHPRIMSKRASRMRGQKQQARDATRMDIQQALRMLGDQQRQNYAPNVLAYAKPWGPPDVHPVVDCSSMFYQTWHNSIIFVNDCQGSWSLKCGLVLCNASGCLAVFNLFLFPGTDTLRIWGSSRMPNSKVMARKYGHKHAPTASKPNKEARMTTGVEKHFKGRYNTVTAV